MVVCTQRFGPVGVRMPINDLITGGRGQHCCHAWFLLVEDTNTRISAILLAALPWRVFRQPRARGCHVQSAPALNPMDNFHRSDRENLSERRRQSATDQTDAAGADAAIYICRCGNIYIWCDCVDRSHAQGLVERSLPCLASSRGRPLVPSRDAPARRCACPVASGSLPQDCDDMAFRRASSFQMRVSSRPL
jgi:hypothetical protein